MQQSKESPPPTFERYVCSTEIGCTVNMVMRNCFGEKCKNQVLAQKIFLNKLYYQISVLRLPASLAQGLEIKK